MYNKATYYLFPLLYDSLTLSPIYITAPDKTGFDLVNLYISDKRKESTYELGNYLFLLLTINDINNQRFLNFMQNIKRHPNYDSYYNPNYKQVMIIFNLNSYQKDIVNHFISGKYSQMDENYKEVFKPNAQKKIDSIYNILTKCPFLKKHIESELHVTLDDDAELASLWYHEEEIFNYSEDKNKFVNDVIKHVYSQERE